MRILHVSAYFAPAFCYGGPPHSIYELCRSLTESGIEISVLTSSGNGNTELSVDVLNSDQYLSVPVKYLSRSFPKKYFYCPDLENYLRPIISEFDVVHIHGCWNYISWKAGSICRQQGMAYIISPRGMLEMEALRISTYKKTLAYALIEKKQLQMAKFIHVTSDKEQATINELKLGIESVVIPNGIDLNVPEKTFNDNLRRYLSIDKNDFVILFVGRIHPIKGIEILCDAINKLHHSYPDIRLILVGDGEVNYVNELKSTYSSLMASNNLFFTGHLNGAEKADAYQSADVFVTMSFTENFGLTIAEAMSHEKPVILSRGCPWPQIEQWNAGYWIDRSVNKLAEAVCTLYHDRSLAKLMGSNAKREITAYLDWKRIISEMTALYEKCIE